MREPYLSITCMTLWFTTCFLACVSLDLYTKHQFEKTKAENLLKEVKEYRQLFRKPRQDTEQPEELPNLSRPRIFFL